MDANERARRYRARKRGEDIPKLKPGPKEGYMQDAEHVEKRMRSGPEHHHWDGAPTLNALRKRACRLVPALGPCERCGENGTDRHHRDLNMRNNIPSNIEVLCERCHILAHGKKPRK